MRGLDFWFSADIFAALSALNEDQGKGERVVEERWQPGFFRVLAGVSLFLGFQYVAALWRLANQSTGMENKFSVLAREEYLGFLVWQNVTMLAAYGILAVGGAFLLQPWVVWWTGRSRYRGWLAVWVRALVLAAVAQMYCTLRLVDTRPYFLTEASFGNWYFRLLEVVPEGIKPAVYGVLFTVLPLVLIGVAVVWRMQRHGRRGWAVGCVLVVGVAGSVAWMGRGGTVGTKEALSGKTGGRPNILILSSDSLRGDKLGCAGYLPRRSDGAAAAGVSPRIDAFAAGAVRFERCYAPIASTMESGVSFMASQYPRTHGIRQMYPDRATVERAMAGAVPMATVLREAGYDTAVIGDWCAGFFEVVPMGFEDVSVSTFDNFKIYMSQAVVLAHFVVPLYFDNAFGYALYPQLESFAQFVTPEVVTRRVEDRLARVAGTGKPFFWHVFYSCNHLPYRSPEPYCSLFTDPAYRGRNKTGVDFDVDEFIGGTDLESKWKALPPHEVEQIRALYDGRTRHFDDCVGEVLEALERHGLADDTIVIITSDHGDDLYEPGVTLGHGLTFNGAGQANWSPLIMRVPGVGARVVPEQVRMIDVMPTLADLVGVAKPREWEGLSFAGWLRGDEEARPRAFYGETGFPFIQFRVPGVERPKLPSMDELTFIDRDFNYQFVLKSQYLDALVAAKQRCLRTRDWKLVCTPGVDGVRHYGLFHVVSDPDGERDLSGERPEVMGPMVRAIERWMDEGVETSIEEIFPGGEPGGSGG